MRKTLQVDVHIHAVETGYQRGNHQCNAEACHTFHDGIHIVGDDGGEGVHGSRQNITVGDFYKLKFCHSDIYMYICIVKQE